MSKVISASDAAAAVKSGDRLAIPGNASILVPDMLLSALEERFKERGDQCDLRAFLPCTSSLGPGTGLDRLAHEGLMTEIIATARQLAADPQLRLVVLTGAGERAFVGGADIGELAALDRDRARDFITLVHRCCDAFRRLPVPVIARIDGYALGAGLELACACDLRVASARSAFGMPEVKIGLPSVVEAALLPKLVGQGRARRLLLTGENVGAAEALTWGLVDIVAPPEALDRAVEDLARPILTAGPQAIRL